MGSLYDQERTGSVDERVSLLAARQHGLFSRAQAEDLGATDAIIKWRVRAGRWQRTYPLVYRIAGSPRTRRQELMAACLRFGGSTFASHRAAAVVAELLPTRAFRVEVIVPRNKHRARTPRWKIHWLIEPIPPEDVTTIDGIPVTKPARTLLDLAATEAPEFVERALDDALRRRLVSLAFLDRWLADPRRSKLRGARTLRRLVDARSTIGVTESPLETDVLKLLRSAGLPMPMLQFVVRDGDRPIARIDFAYPECRVGIEADGFRYHDDRLGFDRERARGNELLAQGWRILRLTAAHLRDDPEAVAAWVRAALAEPAR